VSDLFNYLLIELLPFWQQLFTLFSAVSWPLALIVIARIFRPLISHIFTDRGISFEGFGAQLRIDERKVSQPGTSDLPESTFSGAKLKLPRTAAITEQEANLRAAIKELPQADVLDIAINALAIEQLEKGFALTYINVFGSQITLLQRINERGGSITTSEGEEFFSEVKSRFAEISDWSFERYITFLAQRNLVRISSSIELTPLGRDFIQFVVRYGLRTDKGL